MLEAHTYVVTTVWQANSFFHIFLPARYARFLGVNVCFFFSTWFLFNEVTLAFCNKTLKLEMDGEQATITAADARSKSYRNSRYKSIRLQENQEQSQTRNTRDRASRQLESLEQSETRRQARRVPDRHHQPVHRHAHFDSWRQCLNLIQKVFSLKFW